LAIGRQICGAGKQSCGFHSRDKTEPSYPLYATGEQVTMQFRHNPSPWNAPTKYRLVEGQSNELPALAAELVRHQVRSSRRAMAMSPHLPQREMDALLGIGAVHFRFTR
jgi:hypothetical protein